MPNSKFRQIKITFALFILLISTLIIFSACANSPKAGELYSVTYIALEGGVIDGNTEQMIEEGENAEEVTAVPDDGYYFVKWSDGVTTATRQETNVTFSKILIAEFEKITYSVQYLAWEGGTLRGNAKQQVKYGESATEIEAIPYNGYKFVKWSDGVTTATRQDTNVTSEITVTAEFEQITYTVRYLAGEGGTISGNANQQVKYGENTEEVIAIPNEGYEFVEWSDNGSNDPVRIDENVRANKSVSAIFRKKTYVVKYSLNYGGRLLNPETGRQVQESFEIVVLHGEDAPTIVATPLYRYIFINWSDGLETAERKETNVTSDINITAYFGCSAEYIVNNSDGGKIVGKTQQTVLSGESFERVTAVAADGYVFSGWSDLLRQNERLDIKAERCLEIMAYFEPLEKTFKYDYGIASGTPLNNKIILDRNKLTAAEFIIPELSGYTFCGWYADINYTQKVVNEEGVYMLGYQGLNLQTDTLYAKWKRDGEDEKLTYTILLVFIDEINASLYSTVTYQYVDVAYKMSAVERELCYVTPKLMAGYLNEWFKEFECEIEFVVDSYFTLLPVGRESISSGMEDQNVSYGIDAVDLSEIGMLLKNYGSVLTVEYMHDGADTLENLKKYGHETLLHFGSGYASMKYGSVYLDGSLLNYIYNHLPLHTIIEEFWEGTNDREMYRYVNVYLHEFTHTCEVYYGGDKILAYHQVLAEYVYEDGTGKLPTRLYLLNRAELNGEVGGIPARYWKHEIDVPVNYQPNRINGDHAGKIIVVGEEEDIYPWVGRYVPYGSDMTVEAIPKSGYKFVKWSDGVTTAIRHDTNIISFLQVTAIFVAVS